MATLSGLMAVSVEELRIIQTMLLLVTSTDVVQGKSLTKVSKAGCRSNGGGDGNGLLHCTCMWLHCACIIYSTFKK